MATRIPRPSSMDPPPLLPLPDISPGNRELIQLNLKRRLDFWRTPELFYVWWRRCTVKVLIVADGNLNFGEGDFGLSTFVRALKNEAPGRVRFELTLAHIRNVSDADMLVSEPGIANRIESFRFDNPAHFTSEMYDQIWLFGIETSYTGMPGGRGTFLAAAEISAIHGHMQRGGGVFATGDHGFLGQALCGGLPRVRGMRSWGDFPSSDNNLNQVSMTGPRRNDSNQEGNDPGTSFSDQSDDIPQPLDLLLYSSYAGFLRNARYPHPVLCGRMGRIDVFPDHPHEGECRMPPSVTGSFGGVDEYPPDGGGTRIVPEVVAWGRVRAGNTTRPTGPNPMKIPTVAQTFGVVSAYDGHRAGGKGRVICDSTWHHFVNVNLIGVLEGGQFDEFSNAGEHASKHNGFLSSAAGLAALSKIKNYYTNIGVWISPPQRHDCFNRFAWWEIVFTDRIIEATLTSPDIPLERIPASTLMHIGIHARDVFARRASQCQTLEWLIDWSRRFIEVAWLDPWDPVTRIQLEKGDPPLPAVDPMPIVDVALGAALVSLRQQFPFPPAKISDKHDEAASRAIDKGAQFGMQLAAKLTLDQCNSFSTVLRKTE